MADIAELGIKVLSGDIVKATKRLDKLEKQSKDNVKVNKKLGGSFKLLGGAIAAIGVGALLKGVINTAASFEKLEASLVTVTGSTEKATLAMQGITDFATQTPFQVEEITSAFIKLKALGIEPTEAKLRSFGNTSAAMGKSLDQMIEAVADAATGEFERLKEFGIKSRSQGDQVTFTFQGIATTVKKNSEEITGYLQSIGETQFASGMANQMDTLDGAFSNFGDTVALATKKLGETTGFNELIKSATLGVSLFIRELAGTETIDDFNVKIDKTNALIKVWNERLKEAEKAKDNAFLGGFFTSGAIQTANTQLEMLGNELARLNKEVSDAKEKSEGAIAKAGAETPEQKAARLAAVEEERLDNEFIAASEHTDKMIRLWEMESDKKSALKEKENAINKNRLDITKGFLGNMSTLMSSSSKKEFEIGKKFAIGNALVKGGEAIVSAYAAGAKIHPAVGVAFAASAAAATKVQIDNIKSQSFGGGGGVSVTGGAGGGVSTGTNLGGGAPVTAEQQGTGGVTNISIIGKDRTFSGEEIEDIFDEIGSALERGDKVLFSSNSRQALELTA